MPVSCYGSPGGGLIPLMRERNSILVAVGTAATRTERVEIQPEELGYLKDLAKMSRKSSIAGAARLARRPNPSGDGEGSAGRPGEPNGRGRAACLRQGVSKAGGRVKEECRQHPYYGEDTADCGRASRFAPYLGRPSSPAVGIRLEADCCIPTGTGTFNLFHHLIEAHKLTGRPWFSSDRQRFDQWSTIAVSPSA